MPELPEVETMKRGLQKYLIDKQIADVEVRLAKILSGEPKNILGATITSVSRFGKGLVVDLDNEYSMAIHVKMTGQLIYDGEDTPKNFHPSLKLVRPLPNKWTHVIIKLKSQRPKGKSNEKSSFLYYNDIRQFGWIKIVRTEDVPSLSFFKNIGHEPLKDLTAKRFQEIVSSSKAPIKSLLMDQRKIAGIGNIYANDALYLAKIHPQRSAFTLTKDEVALLYKAVEQVLQKGIESGGASETNYVNVLGGEGTYQNHFLVYNKEYTPCTFCGTEIKKVKLAGRGTYFCPQCQKLP